MELLNKGFFGVGIQHTKSEVNVGTLFRSAYALGASYVFTIGKRYKKQSSDTCKTYSQMPLFHYHNFEEFYNGMPFIATLVGVEIAETAIPIGNFYHPRNAIYLLGAEDDGLSKEAIEKCHKIIKLPGRICLNVATAGSIVMYDRINKQSNSRTLGVETPRIRAAAKVLSEPIYVQPC